ncbi:hypothetical protein [Cohnella cholangitidis]|uniref:Uncharacterized protein n=1 Tax=Cohnella cholangitidis TaxID=2598458 RepID=A0A7G5BV26_9BACL|nr:hypothetical protein [Cohnella cholangitidis]QMV40810.1 hypothetical protein FPL14_06005 [Cohnella cholangitidis]
MKRIKRTSRYRIVGKKKVPIVTRKLSRGAAKPVRRGKIRSGKGKPRLRKRLIRRRGKVRMHKGAGGTSGKGGGSIHKAAFNQAYSEGYNEGFTKGFEDGHQLAYEQQV